MSGSENQPPVDDATEATALAETVVKACDGHDSAAVLAALTTATALALVDLGVPVDTYAAQLRRSTASVHRAAHRKRGRA